jgi:hypothetical protein
MRPPTKLRIGMRSQKTELSGRNPLRKRRSALDCSDIEEEEEEEEEVEGDEEEEEMMMTMMIMMMVIMMMVIMMMMMRPRTL